MKRMRKALAVAAIGGLLISVVGCSSNNPVATINGEAIKKAELDKRVDRFKKEMTARGTKADQIPKEMMARIEYEELERMIDEKLYEQEAKKRNIQVTDQQVAEELDKEKQKFKTDAEYQEALKQANMTEAEIKEMIRTGLMLYKLYENITASVQVSDAEIQKYYKENPNRFKQEKQVKASHILVKTEEEAKAIIAELNKGADFGKLAGEKSIDPSAAQNKGDLGYFDRDTMVKEFSDAAFAMKKGEISKIPVKSSFGFHIIRVEDIKEEKQQTFEEVKDRLKIDLPAERKAEKFDDWFNEVKAAAQIDNKLPAPPPSPTDPHGFTEPAKPSDQPK